MTGHLMVMAGGTGGHVFPALAVANALRDKGTRITWLGTQRGLEAKIVPANNIDIHWISIEGLRGKGLLSWLLVPFKLVNAVWQSLRALRQYQPDCVLGMGGFVAGPGGLAAWLLRTPLIVHEQNAVAGLTNKYLAKLARRVLTGFPDVIDLPATAEWVGNPVRQDIQPQSSAKTLALKVLVIGGSQGAHSFNRYLPALFAKQNQTLDIWHQCGKARIQPVQAAYQKLDLSARVSEFIDDMAAAYAWADVLVCRSGAMTVAECCAAGKAALLVPFPFSAGDHQRFNASALVTAGAAVLIDDQDLATPAASERFATLIADRAQLQVMGRSARSLHKPDALQKVVAICEEYLHA